MRVSLAPVQPRSDARDTRSPAPRPLLSREGARVVLGPRPAPNGLATPIAPKADTLFAPRGACLCAHGGPLVVCDTGHHRLLVWRRRPEVDQAPADFVVGQADFGNEGRNAGGEVGAATLNVPTGVAAGDGVLAVADTWNHRVLLWHGTPQRDNQPADVVLGQADFASAHANRGFAAPRADTLNWCGGVAIHDGRLWVADTGNRRILMWQRIPAANGMPADLVLGQADFGTRELGMRWPHGIAVVAGMLLIADAGSGRVMGWSSLPRGNGAAFDFVLGQTDLAGVDHNRAAYLPSAASMSMPYGLAVQSDHLVVADTANSRLLGFDAECLATGAHATHLAGQAGFDDKGENRWRAPSRDSLCWPYAVAACGGTLVVADSGNNRVLLWDAA